MRKWYYIGFGVLGGATAFALMIERTWTRFHEIAQAISRGEGTPMADIEFNVLFVVGSALGLLILPVGVGAGLIIAVLIDVAQERLRGRKNKSNSDATSDGASWVTRRMRRQ